MKIAVRCVMVCAVTTLLAHGAFSLPRFHSRTGAKCQSCHVNPSGGGMRQVFGVTYGRDELPVPTWSEDLALDDFSTELSGFVSVGADFRTLFFVQDAPAPAKSLNSFWQMQGDVYMQFKIAKKVSLYLDKGLYKGFEIFGLVNILPANGFVKIGKFVPNYGMKLDDHRTWIRTVTGFSPESGRPELTGGEIGFSPGAFTITGGVFNSSDGAPDPYGGAGLDKGLLGRIDGIFALSEDVHLGLSANIFRRELSPGRVNTLLGGVGSISYGNLTVLGEVDRIQNKDSSGTRPDGVVVYIEGNYVLTPGVDLKLAYEFYDSDVDLQSGAVSRYTVGAEFFPISGIEVRPLYRINVEKPTDTKNNEFDLVFHIYL